MKKSLFFQLSVLALLMVFVSACSPKTEYTHAIPADATNLASINLRSLAEKAGIGDKENKDALKKLTDAMKSGMNAANFEQLEAIMKDPSKSGVDITAPIYLFSSPTFDHPSLVAKISNEENLKNFLEVAQKEQISSAISSADGYSYATLADRALLAFNASTLLVVSYNAPSSLDEIKEGVNALLKQTAENSITQNTAFKKMQKLNGDIAMFVSPSSMLGEYTKQLNYDLPKNIDLEDLIVLASLSFEKGKAEMQIEYYTENAKLKALFEKQIKSTRPLDNTFLKYFPKTTLAFISLGVNGEEIYNMLLENEEFRKDLSISESVEVKQLFSSFHNDLTIGLVNVTLVNTPSFLAYASVKSDDALQILYSKKSELGLKKGEDIVKLGENEYVFKSRNTNVFFGIRNKELYATNDEMLYKNIGRSVDPSLKDTDFASGLKGRHAAFVINAEAVLQLPIIKMMIEYGGPEYNMYNSLANTISHLQVVSDKNKATISLQLKDKNVNALKQIVNFVREFAKM